MKPVAYVSKNGVLFKELPPEPMDLKPLYTKLDEDFEDWKPLLRHIMENRLLKEENEQLKNQIKHLEAQVYGGTTK